MEDGVGFLGKYKDVLAAMVFLIFSAALLYNTGSIRVFAPNSANYINAQFFPYLLSGLLGLVSLFQLVIAARKVGVAKSGGGGIGRDGAIRVVATLVLLALYVALLKDVGFLIMTAIYVFCQVLILAPAERRNIPFSLMLAVVSSSVIYFLFTQVLTLMLPRAPFMPF